jgi:hypothetical protein
MSNLTPYDTGQRAEPKLWVTSTQGLGKTNDPDDWGKVDFESDSGETVAVVYMQLGDDGSYTLHVECWDDITIQREDV